MLKKISILLIVAITFIISGCGGGGGSSITLSPEYKIKNYEFSRNGSILNVKSEITLEETNPKAKNVIFSNLAVSDSNCNITYSIKSNGNNDYLLDVNYSACDDISSLNLNFKETADYVDTELKSVSDSFTFNIGKELEENYQSQNTGVADNTPKLGKIILDPSTIIVVNGLSKTIHILTLSDDNKPISTTINIEVPVDSQNKSYGSFNTYTVTTDSNGEANVTYNAPDSLVGLGNDYNVTFSSDEIKAYLQLIIQSDNSEDTNTTAKDYEFDVVQPSKFTIENEGSLIINIVESADNEKYIDKNYVYDVNVSVKNGLLFFNEDKNLTKYEYNLSASKYVPVYTGKYSGIETLTLSAKIFNGEKNVTITSEVPIVVESGPITSISINYVSSSYDTDTGLYEDTYSIHAVDKYSNPAKPGSKIVVGAIVGAKITSTTGKIDYDKTLSQTQFLDTSGITFNSVDVKDSVAIFSTSTRTDGSYLGGWIVDNKSSDNKTLYFSNDYNGTVTNNLVYVIGNEKRNDNCTGGVAVADFDHKDGTYEIGDDGTTLLKLRYDRYLVGKTIALYANSYQDKRIGISMKRILWGTGVTSDAKSCDNSKGSSKMTCYLQFTLKLNVGNNFTMQNTNIGGYTIECKDGNYVINTTGTTYKTDCNGHVELNITVDAGATCRANWNNAVVYEY